MCLNVIVVIFNAVRHFNRSCLHSGGGGFCFGRRVQGPCFNLVHHHHRTFFICKFVIILRCTCWSFCIERVDFWWDRVSGHDEANVKKWGVGAKSGMNFGSLI